MAPECCFLLRDLVNLDQRDPACSILAAHDGSVVSRKQMEQQRGILAFRREGKRANLSAHGARGARIRSIRPVVIGRNRRVTRVVDL